MSFSRNRTTPAVFVRALNSRRQTIDVDRMVPMSAAHFKLEELTRIYNKARIDYLIPMPMATRRLREYIQAYDIVLSDSCVMLDTILSEAVGIGLLGLRGKRAWISRFGLVPLVRGQGYGRQLMQQLLETALQRGVQQVFLELIQDNRSGFKLADHFGFQPLRELLVARRPPDLSRMVERDAGAEIQELGGADALQLLINRQDQPSWLNDSETYDTIDPARLGGLLWHHRDGRSGWVIYENGRFQLKRVTVGVTAGEEANVTAEVLTALHTRLPQQDAVIEDIPVDDPRWPGYQAVGYFETFRRVELVKEV